MLKPQDVELEGNSLCDFVTLDSEDPELEICATATETEASKASSGSCGKGLAGWALLSAAMMMMQLYGMCKGGYALDCLFCFLVRSW